MDNARRKRVNGIMGQYFQGSRAWKCAKLIINWLCIIEQFHNEISSNEYRTKHQSTTKFREMNMTFTKFNNVYNNLNNQRNRGECDTNVYKMALEIFKIYNKGRPFKFVDIWKFLSDFQKWKDVFGKKKVDRKKTKNYETGYTTSLDACFGFT